MLNTYIVVVLFANIFYLVRNVELVDQVKVEKHPQNAFQRQAVVDDCVVELVTERREMLNESRNLYFVRESL